MLFCPARIAASRRIVSRMIASRITASHVLALVLAGACAAAGAQGYPAKPIRYIISTSAGSGADVVARIIASGMTPVLGQQLIVDYRPGASGNIAAEVVSKSPPDGYVLLQATMTYAANVTIFTKLPYDLVRDYAPVTLLTTAPALAVVHPSLPVRSLKDLVRLAKARPGALNYASAGTGTATYVAGELFKGAAGVNMLHVPYRGGGEALTSVLTGETSVYFGPLAATLPHVQQGRLRGLAVTSAKRASMLPGTPTVAEEGYPGFETGNWYGILAPAKTPKETIAAIRNAAIASLNDPGVSKRLADLGYISVGSTPEEFGAHIKSEIEKLSKILKGLRPQ